MGYEWRFLVAPCDEEEEAQAILATRPEWSQGRRFDRPWPGVLYGHDAAEVYEQIGKGDEEMSEAIYGGLYTGLGELSRRFPARSFAYIEVDCFGGHCTYNGHTVKNGERLATADGHDAHVTLLRAAGAPQTSWHFEPFTRGFFEGADPPAEERRQIHWYIKGKLSGLELNMVAMTLMNDLHPPWKVSKMVETWLVSYGDDDLLFSFNRTGDEIDVAGKSHLEDPRALVDELKEATLCKGELAFTKP